MGSSCFLLLIILITFPLKVISMCEQNYNRYTCRSLYSPKNILINSYNYRIQEIIIKDSLFSTFNLNLLRKQNGLFDITTIDKLYILNCSLSKLEEDNLKNLQLKLFDLTNNALLDIDPLYFSKFKSLMTLNVSNNYISSIDKNTFDKLDKLLHLNISGNKLNGLPNKWDGLNALQTLDLSRNHINHIIENFFSEMTKLQKLNLEYNNITKLGNSLFNKLSSLNYINLSHNNIMIVTIGTFVGLSNVTELDISYNKIMTIGHILFHNTHNLKMLNIAFNQLTKLDLVGILEVARLSVIDFDGNPMSCQTISETLKTLRKYQVMVIKGSSTDNVSIYGIKCNETFTYQDKKALESNITEYQKFDGMYFENILTKFSENFTGNLDKLWNNVTAILEQNSHFVKNETDLHLEQIKTILESVQMTFEKFVTKLDIQRSEDGSKKSVPMRDTELTIFSNNLTTLLNKYNNDFNNIKFDHDKDNINMNRLFDKLQQLMSRPETAQRHFVDNTKMDHSNNLSNILYGLLTVAVCILISCIIIIISLFTIFFINKKNIYNVNELQEIL